jgi:capsular polysaccharide biosynthesis protein
VRDRSAVRDITLPNKVYLSRAGVNDRKLANESEVERLFESFGFIIIRPETIRIEQQIALVSNALLLAGPGGSGMFNLAFQGRLRSAFLLVWDEFIQMSEMLLSVGRVCDLWYHLGRRVTSEYSGTGRVWEVDLIRLHNDVAEWLIKTRV